MKKAFCMVALAAICLTTVSASPITKSATDTVKVKNKMKHGNMKLKTKTPHSKIKQKIKDTTKKS